MMTIEKVMKVTKTMKVLYGNFFWMILTIFLTFSKKDCKYRQKYGMFDEYYERIEKKNYFAECLKGYYLYEIFLYCYFYQIFFD